MAMKNSEEAIETVLEGLRNCAPPVGLEQRALAAARAAAAGGAMPRLGWPAWAWGVGLAGSVAGIVAICIAISPEVWREPHPAQPKLGSSLATSPSSADSRVQEADERSDAQFAGRSVRPVRLVGASYSARLRNTRATSHPAPEEPLTEQEKLLLRVVRTGNPHGIAMLDPDLRARQMVEQETEFEKFVGQSTEKQSTEPQSDEPSTETAKGESE
jgi:hypothetical protein